MHTVATNLHTKTAIYPVRFAALGDRFILPPLLLLSYIAKSIANMTIYPYESTYQRKMFIEFNQYNFYYSKICKLNNNK